MIKLTPWVNYFHRGARQDRRDIQRALKGLKKDEAFLSAIADALWSFFFRKMTLAIVDMPIQAW